MSDSNPRLPPADDSDDIIDLSDYVPIEEGSAVLSFSGRASGPTSGSSIVSWDELARVHGPSEDEHVELDGHAEMDFDAESDIDLLRKVLSKDPPPSQIILKDPSSPETPALSAEDEAYDAAESALEGFEESTDGGSSSQRSSRRLPRVSPSRPPTDDKAFTLPPELAAETNGAPPPSGRHPGGDDSALRIAVGSGEAAGSAILRKPTSDLPGPSSDLWNESSRVDLLAKAKPLGVSSGSLPRTNEIDDPARYPSARDNGDSDTLLGEPNEGDIDSSAVDLGSHAAIHLPFPLGLDSSVGSSASRRAKAKPSSVVQGNDSGTVDLLGSSEEFDLAGVSGMSSVVRELRTERDDLPPTTPLVAPQRSRTSAWLGGSLIGALATAATAAGVWYAGYVPPSEQFAALAAPVKPATHVPAAASAKALADAEAKATKLVGDLEAQKKLTKRAQSAATEAGQARAELDRIRGQLTAAKLNPADLAGVTQRLSGAEEAIARARQADQTLTQLLERLKAANLDPASLDGVAQTLAQAKTAADDVRKARAEVEALKGTEEQLQKQTAELATAQAQLSDVVKQVTTKLQTAKLVGANPPPGELLAALDRVLQAKPAAEPSVVRGVPTIPVPGTSPPAASTGADQLLATGFRAVTARDYAAAINPLTAAAQANPRDARAYYLLAVARMQTGESAAAYQLFTGARKVELLGETNIDEFQTLVQQLTPTEQRILGRYRE